MMQKNQTFPSFSAAYARPWMIGFRLFNPAGLEYFVSIGIPATVHSKEQYSSHR